ncbi:MAG: hypothetical protein JSV05_00740 [Candidatus Bathyarchaeota archaeon]|nr:MAG: hypothetical protein JSV05_00740 [Candidatus Bathyarchaeota archaeon]
MFRQLPKDKMFEVMKNLVYVYSSAWFKSEKMVIERYGLEASLSEGFMELFRDFGAKEARRLVELELIGGTNIDSIIKGFKLSHWALFEDIKFRKLSDNIAIMRTIDCSRQKYAKSKWGTEYPCKDLHFSLESRIGFAKAINPKAEVTCSFCPPDQRSKSIPENLSCQWTIKVSD